MNLVSAPLLTKSVQIFVYNSILLTGLEFNYIVRSFLCLWHLLLIDFNVIRNCIQKFVDYCLCKNLILSGPALGVPQVLPNQMSKYQNETVILTYETKYIDKGNPPCDTFTWNRTSESNETIFETENNKLKFKIDESYQGNYTCKCSNEYGETEVSNTAEVLFLPGKPPPSSE